MVSAWASTYGACFGQVAVDKKSNEITAIPKLLNILDLENSVVNANKVFAGMRKMAKYIIDKDKKTKAGQEIRRLKAAWDPTYRLTILNSL